MMHATVAPRLLARSRCSAHGLISGTSYFRRHAVLASAAGPSSTAASADPPPASSGLVMPVLRVAGDTCRPLVGTVQARLSKSLSHALTIGVFCGRRSLSSASASEAARYFEGGPWYEKYLLLEEYKKEHGNCFVPQSYCIGEAKLGVWVNNQRDLYKKGKLSSSRREMLDALGFSWDPRADKRERNFALLEQYKEREGHSNVPESYEEVGAKLGRWLASQRQLYKNGQLEDC